MTADRAAGSAGWVYLDPDDAREHPHYGVFGWALILLGALFLGPVVLLWQDVEIVFGPYDRAGPVWMILMFDVILLGASWTACRLLGGERPAFFSWFYLTVILAICSLAAFVALCLFDVRSILAFGVPEPQPIFFSSIVGDIPGIVGWGIGLRVAAILFATIYVMQSQRLSVTVSKRVLATDPFLARAWQAPVGQIAKAEPAAPAAAARVSAPEADDAEAAAETAIETAPAPPDDRRLRARLKQLEDARAAGLISDAEYNARRLILLSH